MYFADRENVYVMRGGICRVLSSDPDGFEFLRRADGSHAVYGKDSRTVYLLHASNRAIEGADSDTFEVLCTGVGPPHYARDADHLYDFGEIVEGVDPDTFRIAENCG